MVAIGTARTFLTLLPAPFAVLAQQGGVFRTIKGYQWLLVSILILSLWRHWIFKVAAGYIELLLTWNKIGLQTAISEVIALRRNKLDLCQLLDLLNRVLAEDVDVNHSMRASAFLVHNWDRKLAYLLFTKPVSHWLVFHVLGLVLR